MPENKLVKLFAKMISRVFGPLSTVPLIIVYLLIFHTGLDATNQLVIGGVLLISNFILPVAIVLFYYFTKRISDIDITNREEREQILVLILVVG